MDAALLFVGYQRKKVLPKKTDSRAGMAEGKKKQETTDHLSRCVFFFSVGVNTPFLFF